MIDDAEADHEIVLVIVGGVRKGGRKVIDLNGAHGEPRADRHVNTSAHARGKFVGAVTQAGFDAARVRHAHQYLRERLRLVPANFAEPGLRKLETRAAHE